LKPGGKIALVVANAQFAGENVPTDVMLCEMAQAHGLKTESIWITRYKGNSSATNGHLWTPSGQGDDRFVDKR